MRKDKRNLMFLVIALVLAIFSSYLLFVSGITNKLNAGANRMSATFDDTVNISFYPIITMVVNSSGEKLVNENVAITVKAEGAYKIDKIYYSYDMKKWKEGALKETTKKDSIFKLIFDKTMKQKVYIIVENEKGYKSYPYETMVNIDKEKPQISVSKYFDKIIINASDNIALSKIQYSNDMKTWEDEIVEGKEISIQGKKYSYVRVVDIVGNISKIKKIEN